MKLCVAYGSNLSMDRMANRCPDARPVGSSALKDCRLTFRDNGHAGVANIERCTGSIVPVGIYAISEWDEICLDGYEGYPRVYKKEYVNLNLNGKKRIGIVYVMTEGRKIHAPSKQYAGIIRAGYEDFDLNTDILETAIYRAFREEKRELCFA